MEDKEDTKRREAIKSVFRNHKKVDEMSKEQVTAIYLRLKAQGRL